MCWARSRIHTRHLEAGTKAVAPQLTETFGNGFDSAADLLPTARDNTDGIRNEATFVIIRCLKRYVAHAVYALLPPMTTRIARNGAHGSSPARIAARIASTLPNELGTSAPGGAVRLATG